MAKKPSRSWVMVLVLGPLLAVVVVGAMLASFTALYDVARVNGVGIPALLPIVVDVGMIASNAATVYFRKLGLKGRWVAYVIFVGFVAVSVYANITHAWLAADLTQTTIVTAIVIAALFPVAQLGVTHMMLMLLPDEKERARLQRERASVEGERERAGVEHRPEMKPVPKPASKAAVPSSFAPSPALAAAETPTTVLAPAEGRGLHAVPAPENPDEKVRGMVLEYFAREGKLPTGSMVSEWRGGGDRRTGSRFLQRMKEEGLVPISTEPKERLESLERSMA